MLVDRITTNQTADIATSVSPQSEPEKVQKVSEASSEQKNDVGFLREVLEVAQSYFQISDVSLDFSVHGGTGRIKVSVTDKNTGELIREIPPEQVLNLMAKLDEMMGILFDQKA